MSDGGPNTIDTAGGITIADGEPQAADAIEAALLGSLQATLPQSKNASIILTATDDDGKMIAGLTASTSYGWLLIKTLWVTESKRSGGLGRALMTRAEAKARTAGCHAAWLDTSNPSAKAFYDKLGYQTFGALENVPGQDPSSHRRWFMKKAL